MKRSALKRKTELRADQEAAREFERRARQAGLGRDPVKFAEFVRRGRGAPAVRSQGRVNGAARSRREGPLSPEEWRRAVALAADLRCIVTGARAYGPFDPAFDAHHALPKRELRARGLHMHVYDARNGVFVAQEVHADHEYGAGDDARIARGLLPPAVWSFCAEMDRLGQGEWATVMVERQHPPAGSRRGNRAERVV